MLFKKKKTNTKTSSKTPKLKYDKTNEFICFMFAFFPEHFFPNSFPPQKKEEGKGIKEVPNTFFFQKEVLDYCLLFI